MQRYRTDHSTVCVLLRYLVKYLAVFVAPVYSETFVCIVALQFFNLKTPFISYWSSSFGIR